MRGVLLLTGGVALVLVGRLGGELTGASSTALGWKQWSAILLGIAALSAGCTRVRLGPDPLLKWLGPAWAAAAMLAVLALLLGWSLLVSLDQSLWHDEAFTTVTYVEAGPKEIFFGTYVPNDHVLFNALAWLTTSVVGMSEIALRFWSVVPALAAAVAIVAWAWTRLGRWVAVATGVLVATSPVLIVLARQARGYGLTMLAGVLMLVSADRLGRRPDGRGLVGFGAAGLIGIATLPVFSVAYAGEAAVLMAARRTRVRASVTLGVVGLASLILYVPLLGDVLDSTGQQFGRRLPWHGPFTTPATDLLGPSAQIVARARLPPALPDAAVAGDNAIAGALALAGAILLWRSGERMLTALLVAPLLTLYAVLTLVGFHVEPRFAAFLLLHTIVLAGCGVVALIGTAPHGAIRRTAAAAAAVAAGLALVHAGQIGDELHDLPHENFKQVAAVARAQGATRVLTDSTRPTGLQYYLGTDNVTQLPAAELERRFCSPGEPFVYVEHPFRVVGEEPPPDLSCLERRGASFVRVRQLDRGGHIDVWTVRAAGGSAGSGSR